VIKLGENAKEKTNSAYESMSEEEVVKIAADGDKEAVEALISRYKNFVKFRSKFYFLAGGDNDDIIQEGMIGLFKAIRSYDGDRFCSFRTFADICIKRQIISAVKRANRKKHIPLNSYVSIDETINNDDYYFLNKPLGTNISFEKKLDPQEMLIKREEFLNTQGEVVEKLSDFEKNVFYLFEKEFSYREIAENLGTSKKSVDNALRRIKIKIKKKTVKRQGRPRKTGQKHAAHDAKSENISSRNPQAPQRRSHAQNLQY
jgi:RNA polymerase sporulation-specific sigma factor